MPSQSVLVIGGGLAGLASAVALAEAGIEVRLFEKRPHSGWTRHFLHAARRQRSGQLPARHARLLHESRRFLSPRRSGRQNPLLRPAVFRRSPGPPLQRWKLPGFLPPLHMAPSFLSFDALKLCGQARRLPGRCWRLLGQAAGRRCGESVSMLDWLQRMKQTPGAIERFWRVVLVSALDEELARTDARYGIDVFWKAFLGNRGGYRVGIPSVPLGELYEGCREAIASSRGSGADARPECAKFACATASSRTRCSKTARKFRQMLASSAVPHNVLLRLCRRKWAKPGGTLAGLQNIRTSPITGVHLWFDRAVMEEPFLALARPHYAVDF